VENDERKLMEREIEAVLSKYGIRSTGLDIGDLSTDDYQRVRRIAMQIVHGNIDPTEVSGLNDKLRASVDAFVKHLIGLKTKPGLRGLEERNPYYSALSSGIIRDGASKKGE